ncbi:hypothetical protein [Arundinibacter roseus]|uniref:Uncharacterized protein n=1 Tax=Arundinibacter roseus TaxID=2070510 RepID=A0A4R4KL94_9BACT|nr:hypothetical protein [Arundinibacter roseus]TDB69114.1 hypothetical protein EZE20_01905 [Arundinibacter roseus]
MIIIRYRNKTCIVPEGWHECSSEHWGSLIAFSRLQPDERTPEIVELAAQYWLMLTPQEWSSWLLDACQWEAMQSLFAWVFSPPTTRPFESFVHEGISYHVFEENFTDTKALELSVALMEYMALVDPHEPDLSAYERILATLCRPTRRDLIDFQQSDDWDGDVREPYNEARTADRGNKLTSLPETIKLALFDYFERSILEFLKNYERIFGGSATEEPRYPDGRGWIMLLKNVAKESHFGDFDRVCRQPAHLVWAAMLDDVLNTEETQNANE